MHQVGQLWFPVLEKRLSVGGIQQTPLQSSAAAAPRAPCGCSGPCCYGGADELCLHGHSGQPPAQLAARSCLVWRLLCCLWVDQTLEQLATDPMLGASLLWSCPGLQSGRGGHGGLGLGTALLMGKAKSWCRWLGTWGAGLVPVHWWVSLGPHDTDCVSRGVPGLVLACWWVGEPPVVVGQKEDSSMVPASASVLLTEWTPQYGCKLCQCGNNPRVGSSCLLHLWMAGGISKFSMWVRLSLLSNDYLCAGTWDVWDCACALEEGSLLPTAFLSSCTQGLLGFRVKYSWGSSFQCRTLGWGAQCGVVTHCSLGRTSEVVNTLLFVGRLLWMWVLVLLSPLLPICGSFFLSLFVENLFLLVFRSL